MNPPGQTGGGEVGSARRGAAPEEPVVLEPERRAPDRPPTDPPEVGDLSGSHPSDPAAEAPSAPGGSATWALVRLGVVLAAGLGAAAYFGVLAAVGVVLAIVACLALHELGHYVTAKLSGMKVTEFFLGFGPRLWSVTRGETTYGIKAIPAGAYVRIVGMSSLDEVDPADEPRTFRAASFPRRLAVATAGSLTHGLIALVLYWSLVSVVGLPGLGGRIEVVGYAGLRGVANPAQVAGLRPGDVFVAVDGRRITNEKVLVDAIESHAGRPVRFLVERDGRRSTVVVRPVNARRHPESGAPVLARRGPPVGAIGVQLAGAPGTVSAWRGLSLAGSAVGRAVVQSADALGRFFSPAGLVHYAGELTGARSATSPTAPRLESPIGVARLAAQAAESGPADAIFVLFLINVFLGLFNLVPLLPLDGGHVAVAVYERLRSRRGRSYHADAAKLLPLTYAVFLIIVFLGVTAAYLDIVHPLPNPFR